MRAALAGSFVLLALLVSVSVACKPDCEATLDCGPHSVPGTGGNTGAGGMNQGGQNPGGGGQQPLQTRALAAGLANCALVREGELWCWGNLTYGGDQDTDPAPEQIPGTSVAISMGTQHFCRLTPRGIVECWGQNDTGQLGIGTIRDAPTEVPVPALEASTVVAGGDNTCALAVDGKTFCWGDNSISQVPGAPTVDVLSPFDIQFDNPELLSVGGQFGCAIKTGDIWCWGSNLSEQASPGSTDMEVAMPTVVDLGTLVPIDIAARGSNVCAVMSNTSVWCWGDNSFNQLGPGGHPLAPFQVQGLTNVIDVENSGSHQCALREDRTVWCWGHGTFGQLGSGRDMTNYTPTQVTGLSCSVADIAVSGNHSCALCEDDSAWCWGSNYSGQLGDGNVGGSSNVPVPVIPF